MKHYGTCGELPLSLAPEWGNALTFVGMRTASYDYKACHRSFQELADRLQAEEQLHMKRDDKARTENEYEQRFRNELGKWVPLRSVEPRHKKSLDRQVWPRSTLRIRLHTRQLLFVQRSSLSYPDVIRKPRDLRRDAAIESVQRCSNY